jgi:chemotaxis protein CheC
MNRISPKQLALLNRSTEAAAKGASNVFSKWIGTPVEVKMDLVESIPFAEIVSRSEPLEPVSFGLALQLTGDLEGTLLFLIRETTGYELIDALLKQKRGTTLQITDMGRSVLKETGNIVGSSFINSLVKELALDLVVPGPPVLLHDMTQSLLESVALPYAATQDEVLLIHLEFLSVGKSLGWKCFLIPDSQSLGKVK